MREAYLGIKTNTILTPFLYPNTNLGTRRRISVPQKPHANMMKRLHTLLLASSITLVAASPIAAQTILTGPDGLKYKITSETDRTAILSTNQNKKSGDLSLPSIVSLGGVEYTITGIHNSAFAYCDEISSITIPDGYTTIGEYAFYCCTNMTSIKIPNSINRIGPFAFCYCHGLKSITIPPQVTKIERCLLYGCKNLTDISLPTNLTEIEREAFANCQVKELTLGPLVSKFGSLAFEYCTNLEKITIDSENPYIIFKDGVIYDKDMRTVLTAIPSVSSVTIPTSVTKIAEGAFEKTGLASISLPNTLIEIQPFAFSDCLELSEIEIPEGVETIGACAFVHCRNLVEISLPSTLKELGPHIEGNDDGKISEGGVFFNCNNLNTIYCHATVPPETSNQNFLFYGLDYSKAILYIPAGTRELYASPSLQWGRFQNIVEMDFTGIDAIETTDHPVTVKAVDGRIIVEGADDATVEVYAINGSVVYTGAADTIPTLPHGVYIVRVAITTVKIVL